MGSTMNTMNMMMPLMSVFFCITLPSGMGIYWIASAVFRTIIYLFIDKFFNTKSVDDIIEANKEKAAKKAEKRGEQNAKLEEYAAMKTKNIDRRSISQIANAGKGNALLLAAGKALGEHIGFIGQADTGQQLLGTLGSRLLALELEQLRGQAEVLLGSGRIV